MGDPVKQKRKSSDIDYLTMLQNLVKYQDNASSSVGAKQPMKYTADEAERYKAHWGFYPYGYTPTSEKSTNKLAELRAANVIKLATNPTYEDSLMYDRLHPGEKSIFPNKVSEKEKLQQQASKVNYEKSLLELQMKRMELAKKQRSEKVEDLDEKEQNTLRKIKEAQDIVNRREKNQTIDNEGNIVETYTPYYSKDVTNFAKNRLSQYSDSLRVINITKLMRNKIPDINTGEVRDYLKQRTADIDNIAQELVNKGVDPKDAAKFREMAISFADKLIVESLEHGYNPSSDIYKTAISKAAAFLELKYPNLKRK